MCYDEDTYEIPAESTISPDDAVSYDKNKYVKLIDASPLFSLDREKEYTAYEREKRKMEENLYCYLMAINAREYEPYGLEIVETAESCIKNYNPGNGRFLNYFTTAWMQNYRHIYGRELLKEDFKGIHFTEDEKINLRKYIKTAKAMGIDTDSTKFNKKVAEAMQKTISEVYDLRKIVDRKPCSEFAQTYKDKDDEEYNRIEMVDSGEYTDTKLLQFENIKEGLDIIELTFNLQVQERQKSKLAMLITSKIALIINEDERFIEYFKQKAFFDEEIFEESLRRGEQIPAKDIANRLGVEESSLSRSWKGFEEKLDKPALRKILGPL